MNISKFIKATYNLGKSTPPRDFSKKTRSIDEYKKWWNSLISSAAPPQTPNSCINRRKKHNSIT